MGFETITATKSFNPRTLGVGQSKDAYLKDVVIEDNKFNSKNYNFIMVDPLTGHEFKAFGVSNLKWVAKNIAASKGLIEADPKFKEPIAKAGLMLGTLVRITATEEFTNKQGKPDKKFAMACDPEVTLDGAKFQAQTQNVQNIPF